MAIFKPATGNRFGLGIELHSLFAVYFKSPSFEPLEPVKLKKGTGTGIGILIPTLPISMRFWKVRAMAPLCVNSIHHYQMGWH